MLTRRNFLTSWTAAACLFLVAARAESVLAEEPPVQLAVVVAKGSQLSDISSRDLKRLYMGETISGPHGGKLVPLAHPVTARDRIGFDKTVLGLSSEAAARYWIDRKIRGQSGPPKHIDSPELLQRVVDRVEGSVGYVRLGDLSKDVKVLRIDGKLPGEPGYKVVYSPQ